MNKRKGLVNISHEEAPLPRCRKLTWKLSKNVPEIEREADFFLRCRIFIPSKAGFEAPAPPFYSLSAACWCSGDIAGLRVVLQIFWVSDSPGAYPAFPSIWRDLTGICTIRRAARFFCGRRGGLRWTADSGTQTANCQVNSV